MRHTKIVATVGPSSSAPEVLSRLIAAGVDVFRLNFSHGTHQSHADVYARIREAARGADRHVSILQDLSGPKIRTGALQGGAAIELRDGEELRIAAGDGAGAPGRIFTSFAPLIAAAKPGDRLLLDDGRIELRVAGAAASELTTIVVNGGTLAEHKGINAPGVALPASAVTAKDEDDLRFGLELGADLVALSFVQTADDVRKARKIVADAGRAVPLVAKIERPAAVRNLGEILAVAQGVMIARGDLGLEMPLEQLPRVQKEIIRHARAAGRPAIVATQVLESMRVEPRPTRAEVSDAATAVDQGADAIMLAGETAMGSFPVRAVETLDAVIRDAELGPISAPVTLAIDPTGSRHGRALCEAAVTLATTGQADAIVAVTREGKTAKLLSALRPRAPIYAATANPHVAGTLALFWGVTPVITVEQDYERLERFLISHRLIEAGAVVVYVSVSPELNRADTNFLNLQRVG